MPLRWVLRLPSSSGIRPKALHTAGANLGRQSSRVHRGGGGDTTTEVNPKQSGGVEDGHISRQLSDAVTGDADQVAAVTDHQTVFSSSSYPSEEKKKRKPRHDKSNKVKPEPGEDEGVDNSQHTVLLFPGQGTQTVGMTKNLQHLPSVKDLYETASQILGYDLLGMTLEGPQDALDKTRFCQPAVVVASLAAVEGLFDQNPRFVKDCVKVAGFSVGEITALIFSGAVSLEDGLMLVKARGEAMEYASEMEPSGMMTVFHGADHKLGLACSAARKYAEDERGITYPVCQIANHLYAGAKVIAGHQEALAFIQQNQRDFGIRKSKVLNVQGAFHTPLMQPAVEPFKQALSMIRVQKPRIEVYSNVTGEKYKDALAIHKHLPQQIVKCVKWEQSVKRIYDPNRFDIAHLPHTIEVGPGTGGLNAMLTKLNGKAARRSSNFLT